MPLRAFRTPAGTGLGNCNARLPQVCPPARRAPSYVAQRVGSPLIPGCSRIRSRETHLPAASVPGRDNAFQRAPGKRRGNQAAEAVQSRTLPLTLGQSIKNFVDFLKPEIRLPQVDTPDESVFAAAALESGVLGTSTYESLTAAQQRAQEVLLISDGANTNENWCSNRPSGSAVLLECRGGPHQGLDGWRRDTIPICNALTEAGFAASPMFYSDAEYDTVFDACAAVDVVIIRINPMRYEGVTQSKLDDLLRKISGMGKAVMSHPDVMLKMGAKDALVKIRNLSCGMPDTYAYYDIPSFKENFPKTIATGTRVLKQNRGSQGEGIWVCKVKEGQSGPVTGSTVLEVQEAVDNHKEERTIDDFMSFCERYIVGENGQLIDQRFLPRIAEGELRVNMIHDTPVEIVHKKPVDGGISATLASGAKYVSYKPDDPQFAALMDNFINKDLGKIMEALDMEGEPLPLIWTADFILGEKVDGSDTYFVGEFNCSCVGITKQLHLCPVVAEAAIKIAAACDCCALRFEA